ncbi:MAG: small multi-drug export protein [Candidatus Atribacteria bacterium]|nr:small multi-drug export protein [Candidatus Atribacteria bacterium]
MIGSLFKVFLLAFLPISEVRGAIPYGVLGARVPFSLVLPVALAGNIIPYFLVMYLLQVVLRLFCKIEWFNRLYERYTEGVKKRFRKYARWEQWGILFFVGVPLPFTGVWTGALICFLGGLSFRESFPFILGGLLLATFIVSVVTLLGYSFWL